MPGHCTTIGRRLGRYGRRFIVCDWYEIMADDLVSFFLHQAQPLLTETDACAIFEQSYRLCSLGKRLTGIRLLHESYIEKN